MGPGRVTGPEAAVDRLLARVAAGDGKPAGYLRRHPGRPVGEVMDEAAPVPGGPPPDDLLAAIGARAAEYHGPTAASAAVAALRADPVVSTSNHLGIDTLAVSAQCTLLTALLRDRGAGPPTLVVLGCGTVGLDSGSYPMGLLLYDDPAGGRRLPYRLPVLPNRLRRQVAAVADPYDLPMVTRARDRLARAHRDGEVSAFCADAAGTVLDRDLADPAVLGLPTYRHQAAVLNTRLWDRVAPGVRIVHLGLEEIAADLLDRDLADPDGLAARLLFDPAVREPVLKRLDGERACWDLAGLRADRAEPRPGRPPRHGTVFFWGAGPDRRRVPLLPEDGGTVLRGDGVAWPCEPDALRAALAAGELIPSLLTCFTVLSFARGLACVGGPHQERYLPAMRAALAEAAGPDALRPAPTGLCVADMHLAARVTGDGRAIPAGPLEIAAAGGLGLAELRRVPGTLTVREACRAALPELLAGAEPAEVLAGLTVANGRACRTVLRVGGQLSSRA